ncbi:MAG: type II toxin-antitoxin system RelE/ParE family toxin [Gammaproteobacteria bacterium]|nr:type II toxin-antitoxin system RelE/ParE family toxin [Gammaproteobacteria bacterium]
MSSRWNVQRTEGALRDLTEIVHWTIQNFGTRQADIYSETIALAMEALESGPSAIGAKKRNDLGTGIHALHIARNGRKGRHFIVFRIVQPHTVEVLRILHDSMDLSARLTD